MALRYGNGVSLPYSDADNAFDLCFDGARAIREEPLRFYQEVWMDTSLDMIMQYMRHSGRERTIPACETTGCRAGWLAILSRAMPAITTMEIRSIAGRLLSFDEDDWSDPDNSRLRYDLGDLFDGDACKVKDDENENIGPRPGTAEYAEMGAKGLEDFAYRWEGRLRAHKLTPPKSPAIQLLR